MVTALTVAPARATAQGPSLLPPIHKLIPVSLPVPLSVEVVAPDGSAPAPTGLVILTVDGFTLLKRDVGSTTDLSLLASALAVLGQDVTVAYSGDVNYEPSDPVRVVVPGASEVTIRARRVDIDAPPSAAVGPPGGAANAPPSGSGTPTAGSGTGANAPTAGSGTGANAPTAGSSTDPAPPPASGRSEASPHPAAAAPTAAPPPPARAPRSELLAAASRAARAIFRPAGSRPGAHAAAGRTTGSGAAGRTTGSGAVGGTTGSGDEVAGRRVRQELASYDPRSNPIQTLGILVAAFTLLQIGTACGGLALARGGGGVGHSDSPSDSGGGPVSRDRDRDTAPEATFAYQSVSVEHLAGGAALVAAGDRSRTWAWPGTRTVDAVGAALPTRLAPRSPLLARVTADGTYLRAILGSAWLLAPLAGVALGVAALQSVGGEAIPPAATLTIAIAMLGVLDATAGFVAVLIFATGVLAAGGIDSNAHLRLMLGLAALWFVVPVLAGAVRPLRRAPARRLEESWERGMDFVIASLIGAWAVQKIVLALPGLAGVELELTEHANAAAYCVLAALVVRLGLETLAAHLYPWRLDRAQPGDLPEPGAVQRLGATALRTGIFVFFAYIVVGTSWQLWAGAALFLIPQVLAVYEERVPNSPGLFRALPRGLVELVVMLLVTSAVGALLIRTMDEDAETFVADCFVLMALPGFVLSLLKLFGRDGDAPAIGWGKRIAGVGLLAVGVLTALGLLL